MAVLILTFSLLSSTKRITAYTDPRSSCHNKRSLGEKNACRAYVLPPQMCRQCSLKNAGPGGKFPNCKNVMDITSTGCKRQLRKYAKRNPCDGLRNEQVKDIDRNREYLDFFVYAICEACCDCIPTGAREDQFRNRKKSGKLFDLVSRPNCGTHPAMDICKVWPDVRKIVSRISERPSEEEARKLPAMCPLLKSWRSRRLDKDNSMTQNERDTMPEDAQKFMRNFVRRAGCGMKSVWQQCVSLERNQSRI